MTRRSVTNSPVAGLLTAGLLLLTIGALLPSGFLHGAAQAAGVVALLIAAVRAGRAGTWRSGQ
ncbi:hypothetical protein ABZ951_15445 [Streptomyces sp. NPDC046215]